MRLLALVPLALLAACSSSTSSSGGPASDAGPDAFSDTAPNDTGVEDSTAHESSVVDSGTADRGDVGSISGAPGVWTKMLNWPATTPIGGEGVLVDPVRPSDFYFFYEANKPNAGGDRHVLKSTDFGATWTQIDKTPSHGNAWGVAIDPNPNRDPSTPPTMYTPAGYGDLGVWKSTDGGVTWTNLFANGGTVPKAGGGTVTFPKDKNGIETDFYQIAILPDDPPNHILVTYHYGVPGSQALGESLDGGKSWVVHNVPFGDSHYVYAVDPQTWILVSGWGGPGTYRTTTAGRSGGVISQDAWTKVSDASHTHGSFTPVFDAAHGDLYFPVESTFPIQGIRRSHDGGATWTSLYDQTPVGMLVATKTALYGTWIGADTIISAPIDPSATALTVTKTQPAEWTGGIPPYGAASSFDGTHWVIIAAQYLDTDSSGAVVHNGDVWRYVEP